MKDGKLCARLAVSLLGLALCGAGVGLMIFSRLGCDPASAFELGLSRCLNLSFGATVAIVNSVILIVVFLIDRSYINISSLLAMFLIGYTADGVLFLLAILRVPDSFPVRLFLLLLSTLVVSFGICVYTSAKLGVGAIDLISHLLHDKARLPYGLIRVVTDLLMLMLGWLAGAAPGSDIGLGTVLSALLLGPLIQWMRPPVTRTLSRFF